MACMHIEVASSSSPFMKRSANIMGYVNPQFVPKNEADDSSWLPSRSSKTDDSWLPTISRNLTVTSGSHHRKDESDGDDSWLPTANDNNGKYGTNVNEPESDIDYSWLPSTFIDNPKNINKNATKAKTKHTNISVNKSNNKNNSNSNSNSSNSGEQKKSRNDHWGLARKVVFQSDQQNQNNCSHLQQQDSPSKSRYVVESPTSSGVSSLLQRWKDLSKVENSNNGKNSLSSDGNGSGPACKDNKNDNASHSSPTDSDANLASDKASLSRRLSCPLPSRDSKDSNPGGSEKKKIRVVDIIKKLSREEELAASHAGGHGNPSLPQIRTTLHHKQIAGEQKGIKHIKVSHHLIRGRQAFDAFLMQMERDKDRELKWLVERKAVSKFSHRGHIQSLLRFKLLRLGAEPKPEDKIQRSCVTKPILESNKRLEIMDIREMFNSGIEKRSTDSRKHRRNDLKNIDNKELPPTTSTSTRLVEINTKTKTTTSDKKQEPKPEPMTTNQSTLLTTNSYKDVVNEGEFVDTYSSPIMHKEAKDDDEYDHFYEDEGQFMSPKASYGEIEDTHDRNRRMQALESFHDWMTDSDLDDDESYDTQLFGTDYDDWISHISRPKSDWEDMRQARYNEMLHHSSANEDIQRLLERKSVSSFLGSSLRDLMEQLMVTRVQQSHARVEKQDVVVRKKEDLTKEVEQEDVSMIDEDCSRIETTASPSIEHSFSANRSHNDSTPRSSPAINNQTIMELIYDLRGHMEQLHHEIMDLRKSIKSCVNMQVKLQHSFKQHVGSVQRNEMKPHGIGKHNCSICNDAEVDSLLYRCGHMCTCFKCALELQRTSEECPVCEAPIVDVVKAMSS